MNSPSAIKSGFSFHPRVRTRLFTLEHANRTLPLVRRIVRDIVRQHKKVSLLEEQCHGPEPVATGEAMDLLRWQYRSALEKLEGLIDELADIGCELKDLRRGLVDFRAMHRGRPIEFCWRLDEDRIIHWHDLNAGYHARTPIDAAFLRELAAEKAAASA